MAASRKSDLIRLADRYETKRGPGWSQAAAHLTESGFRPSWARTPEPGITDSTLRDLYDKPRAGRLNAQVRAARRAEIDAYVRSSGLNKRRIERVPESRTSRQRKTPAVFRWQTEHVDQLYIGNYDAEKRQPPVSEAGIRYLIREAYATYPGPADTPIMGHLYMVRALLEIDYDKFPKGHAWQWYVDEARADPDRVYLTKDKAYVRIWVQQTVTRAELEAAMQLATMDRGLGGTWAARFANLLFDLGESVTRVMYLGIAGMAGSTVIQSRGTVA